MLATAGSASGGGGMNVAPGSAASAVPVDASANAVAGSAAGSAVAGGAASTTEGKNANGTATTGVPVTSLAMKLLDVRLKPSTAIVQSLIGDFLPNTKTQHICVARASGVLELYAILVAGEEDAPKTVLKLVHRWETHSNIRQISTVRLTAEKRDLLAVASDSGALSLMDLAKACAPTTGSSKTPSAKSSAYFQTITYGKANCRRSTPGQYLCSDPKGRAVMISAVEKRKLVFVLNHSSTQGTAGTPSAMSTNIASPLEAHRNRCITFATVGVDNGYDNPIFATLEQQYPDFDDLYDHAQQQASEDVTPSGEPVMLDSTKQLAYYELDLGLNHVSRKWAIDVPDTACCLASLPGGSDGPSGVLLGCEDQILYYHHMQSPTAPVVACVVPRRTWETKKGVLIQNIVVHRQKKGKFFAIAQSELGDVFKVSLELTAPGDATGAAAAPVMSVESMSIALLDTLPTANSLNISKKGHLFLAAEFGDHALYQFERIDLPDAPTNFSKDFLLDQASSNGSISTELAVQGAKTFTPQYLHSLRKVYQMDNPSPSTGLLVGELAGNEVSPQIYTLAGRGPTSSLRILRHGASVSELAVSELPGIPGGIFTIAETCTPNPDGSNKPQYSKFIVVSFADATLVLSVGETVEEVGRESGFLTNAPTLACSALRDNSLVQIVPTGVRHIQSGRAQQWNCPGLKQIECASANTTQVLIALAGGELTYFELDSLNGNLNVGASKQIGADICCLDVGVVGAGKSRSMFAAVGCRDQTVRVVSLEPGAKILQQKSSTALKSRPHSISLHYTSDQEDLILMIGLDDGSSLRATVDPITGAIGTSPTRRFLGARPVAVSRIPLEGQSAMLLLSSRPWISRLDSASGKHVMAPLSYTPLDHGCAFSSEAVPEGVVATSGKTLRIIAVDTAGMEGGEDESFNTNRVPLRYTPRQMTLLSTAGGEGTLDSRKVVLAVVESDYNDYGEEEKKTMGFDPTGGLDNKKKGQNAGGDDMDMDDSDDEDAAKKTQENEGDEEEDEEEKAARRTPIRGPRPPESGRWGSCIRLLDPSDSCRTLECIEMNRNEAALCCASVRFHTRGGESLLAVGTVTGMQLNPLKPASSHVLLYRVVNGNRLQLLHRTSVDDGPVLALAHFQGRLLVGIGKTLRLYEMGKRQLLRKCELRGLPTFVKTLQTAGDRAYFGDIARSLHIVRYEPTANRLVVVANDPSPRPIVCQELLDWNTVAVGDKFGNVCILRLPRGANTGSLDLSGQRALWDSAREDSTAKLEVLCQYHVGEVVTSMTRSSLVAGGAESLIYVTATGRIGALVPFTSREDVDFYTQLEGFLRTDAPRPTGRDPQAHRSYFAPVMHVVDGDLCDAFNALSYDEQAKVAERLDRTVGEIMKKLEDTRNSLL
eukprot:Nitzschia sp. Nitz4//scaffold176_size46146//27565//31743//NITZ4_007194-RA/size46146-processed-gene-0.26-mRNA-1//1//CDS//3329539021//8376//frame0